MDWYLMIDNKSLINTNIGVSRKKQLPRTQYMAESKFDYLRNRKEPESIKMARAIAKKMKEKKWTDSWFYKNIVVPWVKEYEKHDHCTCCGKEIVEDINGDCTH